MTTRHDWVKESELLAWLAQPDERAADTNFDQLMAEHKSALPPTVQEAFKLEIASTKAEMQQTMEALREELEQSTQAFNTYRSRAHAALKKTAQEQQAAEARIKTVQAELQEHQQRAKKAEAKMKAMESSRKEKLQQLSQALQTEKVRTSELQSLLVAIGEDVQSLRASLTREAPRQFSSEDEQQRMQLQHQIQQLTEENAKHSAEVSE